MKKIKLNAKPVGATSSRPNFEEITLKNNPKGITLIALIITIIVMLVLVGVTINVALNGGLFEKGEKAAYQTNIATIKEMLALKKAEILADNNGRTPDKYNIGIGDIGLSQKLEDEFKDKLTISEDGTLYYIDEKVDEKEKVWLQELGIGAGEGEDLSGFVFDTWYVNDKEYKEYIKFSEVGGNKVMYSYRLGSGGAENIKEEDATILTWNSKDKTASYVAQPEILEGITANVQYKWVEDTIVHLLTFYSSETGENMGEQKTIYTKAVPEQGQEYPFEFYWSIGSSIYGGSENILNYNEFDENRLVEVNGTYRFQFEIKQGKKMSLTVYMNDNRLSEDQYSFTNNLLVIENVSGHVSLNISISDA